MQDFINYGNFAFLGEEKVTTEKINDFVKKIYEKIDKKINKNLYTKIFNLDKSDIYKKKDFEQLFENLSIESGSIPKCIIIFKAEKLNLTTASLFLKIMEKNIENLYLIFSTNNENNFLKTILSRCIRYNFYEKNIKENHKIIDLIFNEKTEIDDLENFLVSEEISDLETEELKIEILNNISRNQKFNNIEKIKEIIDLPIFPGMKNYFWRLIFILIKNKN